MKQDLSVSVLCCCSWEFVSLFTAPSEGRGDHCWTIAPSGRVLAVDLQLDPESEPSASNFSSPNRSVVVNWINFGTAAAVQLMMLADDGCRCHGIEQRLAAMEDSWKTGPVCWLLCFEDRFITQREFRNFASLVH